MYPVIRENNSALVIRMPQEMKDQLKTLGYMNRFNGDMSKTVRFILEEAINATVAGFDEEKRSVYEQTLANVKAAHTLKAERAVPETPQPIPVTNEMEGENYERTNEFGSQESVPDEGAEELSD